MPQNTLKIPATSCRMSNLFLNKGFGSKGFCDVWGLSLRSGSGDLMLGSLPKKQRRPLIPGGRVDWVPKF